MRGWWYQRDIRERRILLGGALALAVILYLFAFRFPLEQEVAELEMQRDRDRDLITWMEGAAGEIQRLQDSGGGTGERERPDESLFAVADNRAREAGFEDQLTRVEPGGEDGARLNFDGVAFDALVEWLLALRADLAVTISEFSIRHTDEPGRVDAQILLEPA